MRKLLAATAAFLCSTAFAGPPVPSTPDPYILQEALICTGSWWCNHGYTDTGGKTLRNMTINTGIKNLILIIAGQSLMGAEAPTGYTPTNASAVDELNIYDGGVYAMADPPLGSTYLLTASAGAGPGSIGGRIADLFINAGTFNRVIVVPVAVGGSTVAQWDTSGPLYGRICVALARLNAIGFTAQTNVTVGILWGQGEADTNLGTSQAAYTVALNDVIAKAQACGFSGRFFVNKESWSGGTTSANVTNAQAAVVNNTTVFAGGNIDSLTATSRLSDNTHLNDSGMASAASLVQAAMHASGAPF